MRSITKLIFATACLALLTFGFFAMESDDSCAAANGIVKDQTNADVGTYSFVGYTLTITTNGSEPNNTATSITLVDFDHQAEVEEIYISLFWNDLSASFDSTYTSLRAIYYTGNDSAGGTWKFEISAEEPKLMITAGTNKDATIIVLDNFINFGSMVEIVTINGYTKDLSSSFPSSSYSHLDGHIIYEGAFGSYGGGWTYNLFTNTLSVNRITGTYKSPGDFNASNAPFLTMFFKSAVIHVIYRDYSNDCPYLFYGLTSVKTITAPQFDQYLYSGILEGMNSLEEIYYDSVPSVAPATVNKVIGTLKIFRANNATTLSSSTFVNAAELVTVELPNVTTVGQRAFEGCSKVASVTLTSATTVNQYAFNNCIALRNISLPALTTVSSYTFEGCNNLKTVSLASATEITNYAFRGVSSLESVTFGSQVAIRESAFYGCASLSSITASNVISIGYNAFRGCESLSGTLSFTSLTSISSDQTRYPFNGCITLRGVEMPRISTMGAYAFFGCTSLETVVIGNNLGEIPIHAFDGCIGLKYLTLGSIDNANLIIIGDYAFNGCGFLTSVIFPDSLETISNNAFYGSGITYVDTNKVKTIGDKAFQNSGVKTLILGSYIQTIGPDAFNSAAIEGDLEFPISITTIGNYAFNSTQVENIIFDDSIVLSSVTIGDYAFASSPKLTNVSLGNRVSSIGVQAFATCGWLETLTLGTSLETIGNRAFYNCTSLSSNITLPASLVTLGTDAFRGSLIRSLAFASGSVLTTISAGAFQDCGSLRIENLAFPNSLTTIGNNAFNGSGIRGICFDVAGSKLTNIGEGAFQNCSSLTGNVALPNNLTTIGNNAFSGCRIAALTLGPMLSTLGTSIFAGNTTLTEIVLPNTVNSLTIPENTFSGCALENIYISSSVTQIDAGAFSSTTPAVINLWFNIPLTGTGAITLANGAFAFSDSAVLNVYTTSASAATAAALKTDGKVTGTSVINVNERVLGIIGFQIDGSTPLYTSVNALYGSKIVLPYDNYNGSVTYAVINNNAVDRYLSVYASESDFSAGRIARSGSIVPVYPMYDNERITMFGTSDQAVIATYLSEMTIRTTPTNPAVTIESQNVHYGGIITIPGFRQSELFHVSKITMIKADETRSYDIPLTTVSLYAGQNYSLIELEYEDVMIGVKFVVIKMINGEEVRTENIVSVKFRDIFYYDNFKSMVEPWPDGYDFNGWWDAEGNIDGTGGVKAIDGVTRFDIGQVWYAHYKPHDYTLEMIDTRGESYYHNEWTMSGPYTLHVVDDSLYYTDARHTSNTLLFDCTSIPGWSVSGYENTSGQKITGDYGPTIGDFSIRLRMQINHYNLHLEFYDGDTPVSSTNTFVITDWAITTATEFHFGDTISNVSYEYIENGLTMPVPINQYLAFKNMMAGSALIPYENGRYALTLDYFTGTDITIKYTMQSGIYTVKFVMDDDAGTTTTVGPYEQGDEVWLMVTEYYTKIGYTFSNYAIPGGASAGYDDGQYIVITDTIASRAEFCVITITARWAPITYTASFDLSPYTGTVDTQALTNGSTLTIPDVSGYYGWYPESWYWFKGDVKSDVFTTDTELTSEIITDFAVGQDISVGVNWAKKTYTLVVNGYPSFVEIVKDNDNNPIKLDSEVTLWNNELTRPYKEFGGWQIGTTIYPAGINTFDSIMAEAGDSNGGVVQFELYWADIHYQVQYNPQGGAGHVPTDYNTYVVNTPFHVATVDESEFYRYGYTFVGWKYSLDDDVIYNDTGNFEEVLAISATGKTVNFYAVWAQKTYKINYELNGGRYGPSAPTNMRYGDAATIDNPTRVGWRFEGWTAMGLTSGALYYSKSGMFMHWNGSVVDATVFKDLCDSGGTVTMVANWGFATYTTEYLANGGSWDSISSDQYEISIGDIIELPNVRNPKKTGYTFAGWGIDTVNILNPNTRLTESMISDPNKFTLYAIWTPLVYQIQYRYTADYDYSTMSVDYGKVTNVPILDRAGYTFRGWSVTGTGPEAMYSTDGVNWIKMGSSLVDASYFLNLSSEQGGIVTMNAEWTPVEYRLAYNTNGGTGKAPVDSKIYKIGDLVEMKDYKELDGTNGNKIIIGWSLELDGPAVNITEFTQGLCSVADATNTVNLYGVWVNDMCTVIVNLNGCSASSIPGGWMLNADGTYEKLVNYGTSTKEALSDWDGITLSKNGYSFAGWDYDNSTVLSTVNAEPIFEKVNMNVLYIFGGIVAAFAVGAVAVFIRH